MSVVTEDAIHRSAASRPPGVSAELASAVGRALRHLPNELLRAMASGLRTHADDLAPGVLFRGNVSGGCAVGVTLRELAPDAFEFGWLRFWLWQRWRRGVERDVARRYPRLKHLQWYFDEAVAELEEAGCDAQPAKTIGLWLAASAEAELRARHSGVIGREPLKRRSARGAHHRADPGVRGREHEAETERTSRGPEVLRCS